MKAPKNFGYPKDGASGRPASGTTPKGSTRMTCCTTMTDISWDGKRNGTKKS